MIVPPPPPAIGKEPWVLRLRHPGKGILRIHVAEGMTAYLLSKCIIQAIDYSHDETVVVRATFLYLFCLPLDYGRFNGDLIFPCVFIN